MKIYLAARYSRIDELNGYAEQLRALGHTVDARWLQGNHQIDDAGLSVEAETAERIRFAEEDMHDLMSADASISFTETPRSTNSRGGRHVEFGAALAAGKLCIVIGPRENVFHCLPEVYWFPDWDQFDKIWLDGFEQPTCRECGCSDDDCSGCVERTGERCHWVEPDLCSACADPSASEERPLPGRNTRISRGVGSDFPTPEVDPSVAARVVHDELRAKAK